jgi:hypothetical protein
LRVRALAHDEGVEIGRVEVVGLVPARELERCSAEMRAWAALDETVTIEHRLAARRPRG